MRRIHRISYNSSSWQRPTGDASKLEEKDTFNSLSGFGFEDWFFRGDWQIDGWRYTFLQGANVKKPPLLTTPLNVTLYTIPAENKRKWVADIQGLECLSAAESIAAQDVFRQQGWLRQMEEDVMRIGRDPAKILNTEYSEYFLNVRYRLENLQMMPPNTFWPRDAWPTASYLNRFLSVPGAQERELEKIFPPPQRGRNEPLPARPVYRAGVGAVIFTPEHRQMQAKLMQRLQEHYGHDRVRIEVDGIDLVVETEQEVRLYEIKTYTDPRSVIREALGQILEYAYHPLRHYDRPLRLVVVGRTPLGVDERSYLEHLNTAFHIPLEYEVVPL